MNIEFIQSDIEKIKIGAKIQFSARATGNEEFGTSEIKRRPKLRKPDFTIGDVFTVEDKKYVLTNVETKLLILVIAKDWRKEGYKSPEEAKDDYKKRGYFGERTINEKSIFLGTDDFLSYMFTYEFTPLNTDPVVAQEYIQHLKNTYENESENRKLMEKERKKGSKAYFTHGCGRFNDSLCQAG